MTPRDAEEIRSYTLRRSAGGPGIDVSTADDIAIGQFEMLREIAAQLAILNESRSKEPRKGVTQAPISSPARRTSNGKLFYVGDPWQMEVKEDMLRSTVCFLPHAGFKEILDLELNEVTEGALGTLPTVKITRRQ